MESVAISRIDLLSSSSQLKKFCRVSLKKLNLGGSRTKVLRMLCSHYQINKTDSDSQDPSPNEASVMAASIGLDNGVPNSDSDSILSNKVDPVDIEETESDVRYTDGNHLQITINIPVDAVDIKFKAACDNMGQLTTESASNGETSPDSVEAEQSVTIPNEGKTSNVEDALWDMSSSIASPAECAPSEIQSHDNWDKLPQANSEDAVVSNSPVEDPTNSKSPVDNGYKIDSICDGSDATKSATGNNCMPEQLNSISRSTESQEAELPPPTETTSSNRVIESPSDNSETPISTNIETESNCCTASQATVRRGRRPKAKAQKKRSRPNISSRIPSGGNSVESTSDELVSGERSSQENETITKKGNESAEDPRTSSRKRRKPRKWSPNPTVAKKMPVVLGPMTQTTDTESDSSGNEPKKRRGRPPKKSSKARKIKEVASSQEAPDQIPAIESVSASESAASEEVPKSTASCDAKAGAKTDSSSSPLTAKAKLQSEPDNANTEVNYKIESGPDSESCVEPKVSSETNSESSSTPASKGTERKRGRSKSISADVNNVKKSNVEDGDEESFKENLICQDSSEKWKPNVDEEMAVMEINSFLQEAGLNFVADPPTRGDGNCWFRAVADQIAILGIPNRPFDHATLRHNVANSIKSLPQAVKSDIISIIFMGKPRGLADLVYRQKKTGQWVDDNGVMALATAYYLARNINIYSYPTEHDTRRYNVTLIEGGEAAKDLPSLSVFFSNRHYQSLRMQDLKARTCNSAAKNRKRKQKRKGIAASTSKKVLKATDSDSAPLGGSTDKEITASLSVGSDSKKKRTVPAKKTPSFKRIGAKVKETVGETKTSSGPDRKMAKASDKDVSSSQKPAQEGVKGRRGRPPKAAKALVSQSDIQGANLSEVNAKPVEIAAETVSV